MEYTYKLDPFILNTKLYDAAIKGDVNSLHNLLQDDPLILDRCVIEKSDRFMQSPLHVSSSLGHVEFTIELLRIKPELAEQLDLSTRSSPLHLASAKGHFDVVKILVELKPRMCLARDQDGWNPVHVAAVSGQFHILDLLVRMNPHAARERTNAGETILHLCAKYAQLETFKYLVNGMDDSDLINAKDADENTVLHLAVVAKQLEVVKCLATSKKLLQSAVNNNGLTAIDLLKQNDKTENGKEIMRTLKRAKLIELKQGLIQKGKDEKWLKKQRNALMVVASLIATMAFQIGVNPPGGAFQDDSNPENPDGYIPHLIGTSIMANRDPNTFHSLRIVNTISLISSLSVVLLLISGLSCKRLFVVLLMIIMYVATTTTTLTYYLSLNYLTKSSQGSVAPTPTPILAPGPAPSGFIIPQATPPAEVPASTTDNETGISTVVLVIICWAVLVILGFVIRILFLPIKNLVQLGKKKFHKDLVACTVVYTQDNI